jgi:hypothetical protein
MYAKKICATKLLNVSKAAETVSDKKYKQQFKGRFGTRKAKICPIFPVRLTELVNFLS